MLGNLARPSYQESTQGIWPWSYDTCGASQEAQNANFVQKISNCQYDKGRGSPEIDIIEAQPGDFVLYYDNVAQVNGTAKPMSVGRPMISSSLQVSPGVANDLRPQSPTLPGMGQWYPEFYPMVNNIQLGHFLLFSYLVTYTHSFVWSSYFSFQTGRTSLR
jgi:hypothetical protein